jgi:stress-induced morphogen
MTVAPSGVLSSALPVRTAEIERQLQARLQPTRLEVLDESAAHAGHAGANAEGSLPAKAGWRGTGLCMMHCKISLTRGCMPWRSRSSSHPETWRRPRNFGREGRASSRH